MYMLGKEKEKQKKRNTFQILFLTFPYFSFDVVKWNSTFYAIVTIATGKVMINDFFIFWTQQKEKICKKKKEKKMENFGK